MNNDQPLSRIKILESILAITTCLLAIGLIFKIKILFTIAVLIGISGLLIPPLAKAIAYVWIKFAVLLGYLNSRILLSIVFYLFLFPIALLSRLFNKDPMQLSPKKSGSYFSERNHEYNAEDFEHPW